MNTIFEMFLEILRKIYQKTMLSHRSVYVKPENIGLSPEQSSDILFNCLSSDKPCMIARFGANELSAMLNCLSVKSDKHNWINYIKGTEEQWWWDKNIIRQMQQNAGFFPSNPENLSKFTDLMLKDANELDALACWIGREKKIPLPHDCKFIHLLMLEPYWSSNPWTRVLKGKNVVVVHPFAELIEKQYLEHRTELFKNPNVLPFFNLRTVKAVQSIGGRCDFKDWFDALQWMENEIDKEDYDICLIGCGAYGFPLAAHVKRTGRKAVHWGGSLQLLFGIMGNRWLNEKPYFDKYGRYINFKGLVNDAWTKPDVSLRPLIAEAVENACYW